MYIHTCTRTCTHNTVTNTHTRSQTSTHTHTHAHTHNLWLINYYTHPWWFCPWPNQNPSLLLHLCHQLNHARQLGWLDWPNQPLNCQNENNTRYTPHCYKILCLNLFKYFMNYIQYVKILSWQLPLWQSQEWNLTSQSHKVMIDHKVRGKITKHCCCYTAWLWDSGDPKGSWPPGL